MSRRRFRRRPSSRVLLAAAVGLALGARWLFGDSWQPLPPEPERLEAGDVRVLRVVDGDTLIVERPASVAVNRDRELRVRLLGVDAPETVKPHHAVDPFGPEASAFTHERTAGRLVRLEFDQRRVDRYGRILAYVYVNDTLLNEELVRQGLARVSFFPGDSQPMHTRFRKAQELARMENRGIWSGN